MKKFGIIFSIIIICIITGILLIRVKQQDTQITKEKTKVGFILNGSCTDETWGVSHYRGMSKTEKELNLEVIYKEYVPENEESVDYINKLIDDGCKIIVCNSFGYGEYMLEVAQLHPEVHFYHATGVTESKNLATYFGRIYQMRYLCGIVAGLQTETNEIGYMASFDISEVNRGINAFTLGVKSVNPDANVYVKFCYSWNGDKEATTATKELIDNHNIDVITFHNDSYAPLDVADENDVWIIGYNVDSYDKYPDTFLTAAVWDWSQFYTPHILECLQGKFQSKHYWEGVETGIVDIAPLSVNCKSGIESKVLEQKKILQSGNYDVFYGPVYDNEGNIRINEGENMPDYALLNEFDWYVDGVIIDE